jgi:inorganic pyrophosphatase/exopolyphosphatase
MIGAKPRGPFKPFLEFVSTFKEHLAGSANSKRVFVLGNSACDPDSVLGSLLWAYLKNHSDSSTNYLPVVNCLQSEFSIRFSTNILLNLHAIKQESLLFHDQIRALIDPKSICDLSLFDHNQVEEKLQEIIGTGCFQIIEINDHHQAPSKMFHLSQKCTQNIQHLGSCSTIAGRKLLDSCPELIRIENRAMIELIMTIIRMDTFDFNPNLKDKRWVHEDLSVYNGLAQTLSTQAKDVKEHEIFESVSGTVKKTLVGSFAVENALKAGLPALLISDYKRYSYARHSIGYTVVVMSYEEAAKGFKGIEGLASEAKIFMEKESVQILFQIFLYPEAYKNEEEMVKQLANGTLVMNRELMYYTPKKSEFVFLNNIVQEAKLGLTKLREGETNGLKWALYNDDTRALFRKVLEPVVAKAFNSLNTDL